MKKFLAIYLGSGTARSKWNDLPESKRKELEASGMQAWFDWMTKNKSVIVESGGPLGKTKKAAKQGITDTANNLTGYVIVQADTQEAAARLFENHPHFMIFPGESVEVMEVLPIPRQ